MDNLYCKGDESSLSDCRFDGWGSHDCAATEAAGVVCEQKIEPEVAEMLAKQLVSRPKLKVSTHGYIQAYRYNVYD